MWQCPKCRSSVDDSFDVCWSCGTTPDGIEDPNFVIADEADPIPDEEVPKGTVSLSLLMKLVVLIALDLAFLRVQPYRLLSPPFLFALVTLDLVIIQTFILSRRLGPFLYTFLIVGLVASLTLHTFFDNGLFHGVIGTPTSRQSQGSLAIVDRCLTSILGLLLAWATGLWVACRPPSRLRWRITSFFQGALIGLGVFMVILVTFNYFGQATALFTHGQLACLLGLGLAICPLLGGTIVSILRSQRDF